MLLETWILGLELFWTTLFWPKKIGTEISWPNYDKKLDLEGYFGWKSVKWRYSDNPGINILELFDFWQKKFHKVAPQVFLNSKYCLQAPGTSALASTFKTSGSSEILNSTSETEKFAKTMPDSAVIG